MSIEFLLDSANPSIWKAFNSFGLFQGITTNPSLLKRAKEPCSIENLRHLAVIAESLGYKKIHFQAWGRTAEDIVDCGKQIALISSNTIKVLVKIPITSAGIKAAKKLIATKIPITFTACYEPKQVLIASSLGAEYIAPYLGRINDQGQDGIAELILMQEILEGISSKCKLLVASIRDINEINYLASKRINVFTINEKLVQDLISSNTTLEAANLFEEDAINNTPI